MPADQPDLVILGGGMGGYPAAIRAAQLGMKVALVEADKLGGTCLHVGCIPTKALLESSELYHRVATRGPEFGVNAEKVTFDYPKIAARRAAVVAQLYKGVQYLMKKNQIEVVEGRGRLRDRNTVEVGARQLKAPNLIVATGSDVRSLPGLEFDGEFIISSDHATNATKIPESICIIGAGAVGVEFATFYNQLGVKVTVLEALDRLVPLEDEEVSKEMLAAFEKAGVAVHPNGFISVNEWMLTSVPSIHAIGDVVGGFLLAHAAAHEGITAVEDIAGRRIAPMDQNLVTRC